jgi:hypothetical protein
MLLVIAIGAPSRLPVFIGWLVDLLGTQPSLQLIGSAGWCWSSSRSCSGA